MRRLLGLMIISATGLFLTCGPAQADCMNNLRGEVICGKGECRLDWHGVVRCSAFRHGQAVRTIKGKVLCGKGDCIKTLKGEVFCSTVQEGAAMLDLYGVARCEGGCEPASPDYCEARPAEGVFE